MGGQEHQPAVEGEYLKLAVSIGSGLAVQDEIDALTIREIEDLLVPIAPVAEGVVGPVGPTDLELLGSAGGGEDAGAIELFRDLYRSKANPARAALDHYLLPGGEPAEPHHAVPGREQHLRQGSGFHEAEALRQRQALQGRRLAIFGIPATGH